MDVILTHNNADFDAIASLLAAHKLYPEAVAVLPERVNGNAADFLTLYGNALPFMQQKDLRATQIERVILVDTQRLLDIHGLRKGTPVDIIDHHLPARELAVHETFTGEATGAATTLLIERLRAQEIFLSSLEATLLALGVYEDTGSLVYGTTTQRDVIAAAWLLEQNAVLDTVRRFLMPPLKPEQQELLEVLLKNTETRSLHGYTVVIAAAKTEEYISEISSVAHHLRDLLDPEALFVVVELPSSLHLVCRATSEAVDVGYIARVFGGGGHERAAAATIHDKTLAEVVQKLWHELENRVFSSARVADLMSYGVQTVEANQPIRDVIQLLRRVGHEGYPVIDKGTVAGLLTQRDATRALEHGLGAMTAREIMSDGSYTLTPDAPISALEQLMVETGWGQIPVVGEDNRLIGIVTRTDLIRYWAQKHTTPRVKQPGFSLERIAAVLGSGVGTLVDAITQAADEQGKTLYLVGGVVRDLLLNRTNFDIDFVVEQDAISFAQKLQSRYGGEVSSFRPFGTAKWILDQQVKDKLRLEGVLPEHIDFATARFEFYEHPTALPTVYNSSVKLDLQRRDFTINALAIQLYPVSQCGRILDFYGGQNDIKAKLIRVLHSLSFVDDPTRILRAVRFAQRLGFTIEPRTAELITTALPMLRRITGERVCNELTLLLRENEPEHGLLDLQKRGALAAIHPAFVLDERIIPLFQAARTTQVPFHIETRDTADLYWHLIGCLVGSHASELCERLLIGREMTYSMVSAAELVQIGKDLAEMSPSQITARLRGVPEIALLAAWLVLPEAARNIIERFINEWRHVKTKTDGQVLLSWGLPPGPRYKIILDRLLAARLDGEILSDADEESLLQSLLDKDERNDNV